jgi:hypothetical protein
MNGRPGMLSHSSVRMQTTDIGCTGRQRLVKPDIAAFEGSALSGGPTLPLNAVSACALRYLRDQ